MKRLFALLMAVLMVLSTVPSIAEVGDGTNIITPCVQHSWRYDQSAEPTCTEGSQYVRWCENCRLQDLVIVPALGHDWVNGEGTDATCTTSGQRDRSCSRCNLTDRVELPALGHDFSEWTVAVEATCKHEGSEERRCSRCNLVEYRPIKPKGHKYGNWVVNVKPTCTEKGEEKNVCERCGQLWLEDLDALGHDWGDWYVYRQASAAECGQERRDCQRCGIFEIRENNLLPAIELVGEGMFDAAGVPVGVETQMRLSVVDSGLTNVTNLSVYATVLCADGTVYKDTYAVGNYGALTLAPTEGSAYIYANHVVSGDDLTYGPLTYAFVAEGTDPLTGLKATSNTVYITVPVLKDNNDPEPMPAPVPVPDPEPEPEPVPAPIPVPVPNPVPGTMNPDELYKTLTVVKEIINEPSSGMYLLGETIKYRVTVYNNTDETFTNVDVQEMLPPIDGQIMHLTELAAGASYATEVDYTVVDWDCEMGSVVNYVTFTAVTASGKKVEGVSNRVIAYTDTTPDLPQEILLEKSVISKPANGEYYQKNELVIYNIVLTNNTGYDVDMVLVSDVEFINEWKPSQELGTIVDFANGDKYAFMTGHKVTDEDVATGWIGDFAMAEYEIPGWYTNVSFSNEQWVRTGSKQPPEVPNDDPNDPPFVPVSGDDCCVRTLNALNDVSAYYTLHICAMHQQTANDAEAAMAAEDYEGARIAWTEAVNALYQTAYSAATTTEAHKAVLTAKSMFFAAVSTREVAMMAVDAPEAEIAKAVCDMMKQQCADLCYALHTAPDTRADSYGGKFDSMQASAPSAVCTTAEMMKVGNDEYYTQSLCAKHSNIEVMAQSQMMTRDAEYANNLARVMWQMELDNAYRTAANTQAAMAVDYRMFNNWVAAREAMLNLLYPQHVTDEIIAQMLRSRVMELCK